MSDLSPVGGQVAELRQDVDEIKERIVRLETLAEGMREIQVENRNDIKAIHADVKDISERVSDYRVEYWKNGGIAAAVTVILNAIGWKAHS